MPRRWRVLPELCKYISEFCIFFSPWYFPHRTLYRIQDPKNRHLFRPFLLFYSSSPPSFFVPHSTFLPPRSIEPGIMGMFFVSSGLLHLSFSYLCITRLLLSTAWYTQRSPVNPRLHPITVSCLPPQGWTLTPDPFISPASSLFPYFFLSFGFLRFSANSLIRPADVYRPYHVSLTRTPVSFFCPISRRFYKPFQPCAWRSGRYQWS